MEKLSKNVVCNSKWWHTNVFSIRSLNNRLSDPISFQFSHFTALCCHANGYLHITYKITINLLHSQNVVISRIAFAPNISKSTNESCQEQRHHSLNITTSSLITWNRPNYATCIDIYFYSKRWQ